MARMSPVPGPSVQAPDRVFPVDARDWFSVAEIEPDVHLVAEPGHVFSWLITGAKGSVR